MDVSIKNQEFVSAILVRAKLLMSLCFLASLRFNLLQEVIYGLYCA